MLKSLVILAAAASTACAANVKYNWDIEWVSGNPIAPKGAVRPIIGMSIVALET